MSSQEPEIRFENLSVGDLTLDNPLDTPPTVVPVREAVPSDYVWTQMAQMPDSAPVAAPYSATAPYPNPPGETNSGAVPIKQIRVLLTRQTAPDNNILLASTTGGAPFDGADNVVENVIPASLGDGYAPTFEYGGGSEGDAGTLVPYKSSTWAVDGLTGRVAFVDPATLDGYEAATAGTTHYYLNYWQYTGGVGGGGGGGAVNSVQNLATDATAPQPLVAGTAADPRIRQLASGTNTTVALTGTGNTAMQVNVTGVVTSVGDVPPSAGAPTVQSLVVDGSTATPNIRQIETTGDNISVSLVNDVVRIDATGVVTSVDSVAGAPGVVAAPTPVDAANRAGLVSTNGTGPAPLIKTIQGGDGIKVVNSADRVDISVISSGEISEDPLRIYVNAATGDDTAYNGRSATVSAPAGPYATLERALQEVQALGWDTEASIELGGATAIPLDAPLNVGGRGRQETPLVIKGTATVVTLDGSGSPATSLLTGSRLRSYDYDHDSDPTGTVALFNDGDFVRISTSNTIVPIIHGTSPALNYLPSTETTDVDGQYAASTLPTISIAADQVLASDAAQVIFEDLRLTADAGEPVIAEGAEIILRRCKLTAQGGGSGNHYLDTRAGGRFRAEACAFIDFDDTNRDFSPPLLAATNSVFSGVSQSIIGELEQCVLSNSFISSRGGSLVQVHGETIAGDLVVLGVVDITDVALNSVTLINGTLTSFTDDVGTDATAVDRLGALYLVSGHMDSIADSTANSVTIESGATAGVLGTLTIAGADAGIVLGGELTLGGLAISGSTVPVNVIDVAGGRLTMLGAIDLDVGDGAAVRGLRLTAGGRATLAGTSGTPDDIDLTGVTTAPDQVTDAILVANGCCLFTAEVVSTSIGLNPDLIKVGNLPAGAKADVANRWGLAVCPLKSNAGTSAPADAAPAIYVNPGAAITDPTTAAVVAAAGDDATGDGSRALPFATLARAAATLQVVGWDETAEIRLLGDLTVAEKTLALNGGAAGAQRVPLTLKGWDAVTNTEGVAPRFLAAHADLATTPLVDLSTAPANAFSAASGTELYIGAEDQFTSLSFLVALASGAASAVNSDIIVEYADGPASWAAAGSTSVNGNGTGEFFATTAAVELTYSSPGGSWVTKDIGGATRYWLRLRIVTNQVTIPQIQVGYVARPGAPVAARDTNGAGAGEVVTDLAFTAAPAFLGLGAGQSLYLSAPDGEPFSRAEYEVTVADGDDGAYEFRYWDGAAWQPLANVRVNSSTTTGPFASTGQTFLTFTEPASAPVLVAGQTRHWIRIQQTTAPSVVAQIELAKDPSFVASDGGLARAELVGTAPPAGTLLYATSGGAAAIPGANGVTQPLQILSSGASGDFLNLPYSDIEALNRQNVETVLVPYDIQHTITLNGVVSLRGARVALERLQVAAPTSGTAYGLLAEGDAGLYGVKVAVGAGATFGFGEGRWRAGGPRLAWSGGAAAPRLETLGVYVECADAEAAFGDLTPELGAPEASAATFDASYSSFRGVAALDTSSASNYETVNVVYTSGGTPPENPSGANNLTSALHHNKFVAITTDDPLDRDAAGVLDDGTPGDRIRINVRSMADSSVSTTYNYTLSGTFADKLQRPQSSRVLGVAGQVLELQWDANGRGTGVGAWVDVTVRDWTPRGALRSCAVSGLGALAADEGTLVLRNVDIAAPAGRHVLAALSGAGHVDARNTKIAAAWVTGAYVLGGHLTLQGQTITGPGKGNGAAHGIFVENGGELDIVVEALADRVVVGDMGGDGIRAGAGARVTVGDSRLDISEWNVGRSVLVCEDNGGNGLSAINGAVVSLQRSENAVFSVECAFSGNGDNGLEVREGAVVTVDVAEANSNGSDGVLVDNAQLVFTHESSNGVLIQGNQGYNVHVRNGGDMRTIDALSTIRGELGGILVDGGRLRVGGACFTTRSAVNGITVQGQGQFACTAIRTSDNGGAGLVVAGQSTAVISDCNASNNAIVGVRVVDSSSLTCGQLTAGYEAEFDTTAAFTTKVQPNGGVFDADVFKGGVLAEFGGVIEVTGYLDCRFNLGTANLRIADGAQVRVAGLLVADGRGVETLVEMERGGKLDVDGDSQSFQYDYTELVEQGEARTRIPLFNSISFDSYNDGSGGDVSKPTVAIRMDTGAEANFASDLASVGCSRAALVLNGAKLVCRKFMRAMGGSHTDTDPSEPTEVDGVISVDDGAEFRITDNLDMNGRFIEGRLGGSGGLSHYLVDANAAVVSILNIVVEDRLGNIAGGAPGGEAYITAAPAANECLYVGADTPFDQLKYEIETAAGGASAVGANVIVEYWDGSAWVDAGATVDVGGDAFGSPGARELSWTEPEDWAAEAIGDSAEWYYVRLRLVTALGTNPLISTMTLVRGADVTVVRAVKVDENDDPADDFRGVGIAAGAAIYHSGSVGECFYIGDNVRFDRFSYTVNTTTAGGQTSTPNAGNDVQLQYYAGSSSGWQNISANITTGTNDFFDTAEAKVVEFPNFSNWRTLNLDGTSRYYLRLVLLNPLTTQIPEIGLLTRTIINNDGSEVTAGVDASLFDSDDDPTTAATRKDYGEIGGGVTAFPTGLINNEQCLVGFGDPFAQFSYNVTTAVASGNSGAVEIETSYWNGTAWVVVGFTTSDSNNLFNSTGTIAVEINGGTAPADWVTNTLAEVRKYWLRLRIIVPLDGVPAFDTLRIQSLTLRQSSADADPANATTVPALGPNAADSGPVFAATTNNSCTYFGSFEPFSRIQYFATAASAFASTSAEIAVEYYDGAAWVSFSGGFATTAANAPTSGTADSLFDVTVDGNVTVWWRGGLPSDWGTVAVDGITKYWVRFRAIAGGLAGVGGASTVQIPTTPLIIRNIADVNTAGPLDEPGFTFANDASGSQRTVFKGDGVNNAIYFGDDNPISQVEYTVDVNTTSASFKLEYYGGDTPQTVGWKGISNFSGQRLSSGTAFNGRPFYWAERMALLVGTSKTGGEPQRLTLDGHNKYWIRLVIDGTGVTNPQIRDVQVNTAPQIPINTSIPANLNGLGVYGGGSTRFAVTASMTAVASATTNIYLSGCEFSVSAVLTASFAQAGAGLVTINGRCTIGAYLDVSNCGNNNGTDYGEGIGPFLGTLPANIGACHVALQGILSVGYLLRADACERIGLSIDGESLARLGSLRARASSAGLDLRESSFLLVAYGVDVDGADNDDIAATPGLSVDKSTLEVFGENLLTQEPPASLVPLAYASLGGGGALAAPATAADEWLRTAALVFLTDPEQGTLAVANGITSATDPGLALPASYTIHRIVSHVPAAGAAAPAQMFSGDTTDLTQTVFTTGQVFPTIPDTQNETLLIGGGPDVFNQLNYTVATASDTTIDLEYWDGDSWEQLSGGVAVAVGAQTVQFNPPDDWARTSFGGTLGANFGYWLRLRVTTAGGTTTFDLTTVTVESFTATRVDPAVSTGGYSAGSLTFVSGIPEARIRASSCESAGISLISAKTTAAAITATACKATNLIVAGNTLEVTGGANLSTVGASGEAPGIRVASGRAIFGGVVDVSGRETDLAAGTPFGASFVAESGANVIAQRLIANLAAGTTGHGVRVVDGATLTLNANGANNYALEADGCGGNGIQVETGEIVAVGDDGVSAIRAIGCGGIADPAIIMSNGSLRVRFEGAVTPDSDDGAIEIGDSVAGTGGDSGGIIMELSSQLITPGRLDVRHTASAMALIDLDSRSSITCGAFVYSGALAFDQTSVTLDHGSSLDAGTIRIPSVGHDPGLYIFSLDNGSRLSQGSVASAVTATSQVGDTPGSVFGFVQLARRSELELDGIDVGVTNGVLATSDRAIATISAVRGCRGVIRNMDVSVDGASGVPTAGIIEWIGGGEVDLEGVSGAGVTPAGLAPVAFGSGAAGIAPSGSGLPGTANTIEDSTGTTPIKFSVDGVNSTDWTTTVPIGASNSMFTVY